MTPEEVDQFLSPEVSGFRRPWTSAIDVAGWRNVLEDWSAEDAVAFAVELVKTKKPADIGPYLYAEGGAGGFDSFLSRFMTELTNGARFRQKLARDGKYRSTWTQRELEVLDSLNWTEVGRWSPTSARFGLERAWNAVSYREARGLTAAGELPQIGAALNAALGTGAS